MGRFEPKAGGDLPALGQKLMPGHQHLHFNPDLSPRGVKQRFCRVDFLLGVFDAIEYVGLLPVTQKRDVLSFEELPRSREPILEVFEHRLQDRLEQFRFRQVGIQHGD